MLIDFHTHCFPDALAPKAIPSLAYSSGLIPYTDGTLLGLKESMVKHNTDISVVLNIATNAHQQAKVNDFAASINNQKDIFAFGSVFPFAEDALCEVERIKSLGLKGIKLHPDYQGFSVDDERLKPLYKKISSLGLITVFHSGVDLGFSHPYGNTPEKLIKALSWFSAPVVAAHWGGPGFAKEVTEILCGIDNLYFDLSFGHTVIPRYYALKIVEQHGTDKLLFGTDSPWHTAEMEMALLNTLELSQEDKDKIFYKNACRLLNVN